MTLRTGMYRRKDDKGNPVGNWIAWIYLGSRNQPHKSTGTKDEREARAIAHEWYSEMIRSAPPTDSASSIAQAWNAFQGTDRYRDLSNATKATYRHARRSLASWIDLDSSLSDLTPDKLENFVAHLQGRGLSAGTINVIVSKVRVMLRLAVRRGWIERNPAEDVDHQNITSTPSHKRPIFTTRQMNDIQSYMTDGPPGWRHNLFPVYRYTGCRTREALALRRDGVDLESGWLHIPGTKSQAADRHVPIFDPLRPHLEDQIAHVGGAGHLFPGRSGEKPISRSAITQVLRRASRELGFRATPRMYRRTFASWIVGVLGRDALPVIQTWLGHANPVTTFAHYHGQDRERERQLADRLEDTL